MRNIHAMDKVKAAEHKLKILEKKKDTEAQRAKVTYTGTQNL